MESTSSIQNAASNAQGTVDRLAQGAHRAVDRVTQQAQPALERVRDGAEQARSMLNDRIDEFSTMQEEWVHGARDAVRERPITYLAAAVVAGMLLSRWIR